MPNYGTECIHMLRACDMLEACRFSYKTYAQTLVFPMDPFYEGWGEGDVVASSARDRLITYLHDNVFNTTGDNRKFDPIAYKLDTIPDPRQGVVYRSDVPGDRFILFQPRDFDIQIGYVNGFDLSGTRVGAVALTKTNGNVRCCHFQGKTGGTRSHDDSGWTCYLGSVLYFPDTKKVVIVFRGSRSGAATRAALQAQFSSKGSPDWVTDMNHLNGMAVPDYNNNEFSAGFYLACRSSRESLIAAYQDAVGNREVKLILITGHSLGGALAQNAYVDMTCGPLGDRLNIKGRAVSKYCYPIAGPPICLGHGSRSQRWVSFNAGGSNIHHFFNPCDAIHDSPLVIGGKVSRVSAVLGKLTHPDPRHHRYHVGSETALANEVSPAEVAHEPDEIRKGMMPGSNDSGFWPTFTMDATSTMGTVYKLPADTRLYKQLAKALERSASRDIVLERARLWKRVIKDPAIKDLAGTALKWFEEVSDALDASRAEGGGISAKLSAKMNTLETSMKEYGYNFQPFIRSSPKSHSASSSFYYTLLIGIVARRTAMSLPQN